MSKKTSKNIAFRLHDSLVESLDKVANDNGTTRTNVVVQFLNEGLERLGQGKTQVIRKEAMTKKEVEEILEPILNERLRAILKRIQALEQDESSNLLSPPKIGTGAEKNSEVETGVGAVEVEQLQQEIKLLKQQLRQEKKQLEGCNEERLEALNRAGIAEMEIKVLRRKTKGFENAIAILRNALNFKANAGGAIKREIEKFINIVQPPKEDN